MLRTGCVIGTATNRASCHPSHPISYFIFSAPTTTTPFCFWLPPGVKSDQLLLQIWGSFSFFLFCGWLAASLTHIQLLVHLPWSTPAQNHCAMQYICVFEMLMWITINFLWRMSDPPMGQSMRRAGNHERFHFCGWETFQSWLLLLLPQKYMAIASFPRTLTQPKKLGSPMLETIFQRKHLPAHRCCMRLWSPNHAEMISVKVFLKGIKHSINVRPYYFLLFLLLYNGLYLVYHTLCTAQSRVFWPSPWNVSLGSCPLALSRHSVHIFKNGFTWTELTKALLKQKRCSSLRG